MKMKFDTYNCRVRHNGNVLHEIPLYGITNRELVLLKNIHGADAIVGVTKVGEVERDDKLEYFRIIEKFGSRDDMEATARMKQRVEKLFSVTLEDFEAWLSSKMEDASDERDAKREQHKAEVEAINAEAKRKTEEELRAKIRAEERAAAFAEFQNTRSQSAVAESTAVAP